MTEESLVASAALGESDGGVNRPRVLSPIRGVVLIGLVGLANVLSTASSVTLAPLLPNLQQAFHSTLSGVTWALTISSLGAALGSVVIPRLADVRGDRRVLVGGSFVMVLGLAICALVNNLAGLIVGQFLTGVGTIASLVGASLLRRHLADHMIGAAVASVSVGAGVGLGVGYIGGGLVLEWMTITAFFWINVVVLGAVTVALWIIAPKDRPEDFANGGRVGVPGAIGMAVWIVLLLLAFVQGPTWGWTDPRVLVLTVGGIVGATLWVLAERRSTAQVFDLGVVKQPSVWGSLVAYFLVNAAFIAYLVLSSTYMESSKKAYGYGLGLTSLQTGECLLFESFLFVVGSVVGARALERGQGVLATALGALASGAGAAWLAFAHGSVWEMCVGFVVFGFGFGLFTACGMGVVQIAVSPERSGMAMGMSAVTSCIGAGLGGPIATVIIASHLIPNDPDGMPTAAVFLPGFLVVAGLCALSGVINLLVSRRIPRAVPAL